MFTQYLTSFFKEAEQEIEGRIFEFEKEELTLEILDKATPGWIIEPLDTPFTVSRKYSSVVSILSHTHFVLSHTSDQTK